VLRFRAERRLPYHVVSSEELAKVSGVVHHEGVCFEVRLLPPPSFEALRSQLDATEGPVRLLYLDGIDNPHNLGAILRSAAHFGAHALLGAKGRLPRLGPAAVRIAQGGAEVVPIVHVDRPTDVLGTLAGSGFGVVATDVREGPSLWEAPLPPRVVFLLGAERAGLSRSLRRAATSTLTIPGTGGVESLNVATASAVLLAEHTRRSLSGAPRD